MSNKNAFTKIFVSSSISIFLAIGAIFGFVGCDGNEKQENLPYPNPDTVTPVEPETPTPETPNDLMTFDEFIDKHSDKALAFANTYTKEAILEERTPLSETWGFHANEEEKLDSVSLTFTYALDETQRAIEIANMTFVNPIALEDIVDEVDFDESALQNYVTRETAFEFDAKDVYMNSEFASVICDYVSEEATTYFNEEEKESKDIRVFRVAEQTPKALNIYQLRVVGETNDEVVSNLSITYNRELTQIATYPIGDKESATFTTAIYEQEEFSPEEEKEEIKDINAEIAIALDKHFLPVVGKKAYGTTFDANKLESYTWDIGDGETITQVKLIANYLIYDNENFIVVETVNLKKPIAAKDLTKENIDEIFVSAIEGAKLVKEYVFSYCPQEQGTRDNLVNAIFKAYGLSEECPEGAVRYFVDQIDCLDSVLGEAHGFKVIQIQEGKIIEFTIRIKKANSDSGYIENLTNEDNYRFFDEKSCEMTGKKISMSIIEENNEESETTM